MASPVPAKSQPLHYFSLPPMKWPKNHTNNHHRGRSRLSDSSTHQSPPSDADRRQSPAARRSLIIDSASEADSGYVVSIKNNLSFEPRQKFTTEVSDKKSEIKSVEDRKSKIYIRLPKKKADDVEAEADESAPKTWNLRPRRPLHKQIDKTAFSPAVEHKSHSPVRQNRPEVEVNTLEKSEKKHKFSISLSREEIEEDIFALTGSKPSRRPKKRARAIQKQLDNVFPGLWLGVITEDSYKVSDAPPKV
jgi:hypothetical protein